MAREEECVDRARALLCDGRRAVERVVLLEDTEGLGDVESLAGQDGPVVTRVNGNNETGGKRTNQSPALLGDSKLRRTRP